MTDQRSKHPRPHWKTAALGTVLGAAVVAAGIFTVALALNPLNPFEIDGNAADGAAAGSDWAAELPLNGPGETFVQDQIPPLATERGFTTGGSKDDNAISQWKHTGGVVTPNKSNITNAYAKTYIDPSNGHLIIAFGADRFDDEGDAAMGFWFFENDVTAPGTGNSASFAGGPHTDNDVLIQVDYVNGGSVAEVQVFQWRGNGTGNFGSGNTLLEIGSGSGAGNAVVCNSTGPAANSVCITTNSAPFPAPWVFDSSDDAGTTPDANIPANHFIEGAIDITALFGNVCFSSFMAETRTSHSETATLKDFALGDFNVCAVEATNKDCDQVAGVSPLYDQVTDLFQTRHTFTIQNGFGQVFDVQIKDNTVGTGTTCDVVQINGVNVANIPLLANTWVDVAPSLAPSASMTVGILCQSSLNPLVNSASVRASANDGGPPIAPDANDTAAESNTDADVIACGVNVTPLLQATKACKTLLLDPETFKPQACVTVSVTNPLASQQTIDVDSFTNFLGPDGVNSVDSESILAAFQTANGGSLALPANGTAVTFDVCYEPTGPDNGETDPGLVMYSDTVKVVGTGRINDAEAEAIASTSCKLCPSCPDCPPE